MSRRIIGRRGARALAMLSVLGALLPMKVGTASGVEPVETLTFVAPNSSLLHYEGRWDIDEDVATTVNSGSRISLRFDGDQVIGRFNLDNIERFPWIYVYVDGVKSDSIRVDFVTNPDGTRIPEERILLTPEGLEPGPHELVLAVRQVEPQPNRWTPPLSSALKFEGFEVSNPSPVNGEDDLRLTFLGDSITQGMSVQCNTDRQLHLQCADGTLAYPWLVADAFDAGLEQVAFGGQGVQNEANGEVPRAIDSLPYNFAGSPTSPFDADVVVINQGTNDSAEFTAEYLEYLHAVRAHYPDALILAMELVGTLGTHDLLSSKNESIRGAVEQFDDDNTLVVSTQGWVGPLDFTDGIHPNVQGHQKMAARLAQVISDQLGVTPA